ncbi:hypothetical protein [Lysobacter arvi]|uniref:Uncharacterized protein n=1 Tax=Lysobacter arvi TaxID=3038776 RepID=A0ABU1C950_9GAMM|nr:hypothetical protein [Lysobacter arvi]MDR0181658.1 hypothetical protein [Lysobacter arvi]
MKKWLACLMMVCVIGNAAAQSTVRGESDNKDHPKCEGQHDCRDYQNAESNGPGKAGSENGAANGNGKAKAKGKHAGKAAKAGASTGGISAAAGIAAGVGAVAVAAAAGGGGHHDRAPKPSSP